MQPLEASIQLVDAKGRAGMVSVRLWFEQDDNPPSAAGATAGILSACIGDVVVTVVRAINLPQPTIGSLAPYVKLRWTPGPVADVASSATPVFTGAMALALLLTSRSPHAYA